MKTHFDCALEGPPFGARTGWIGLASVCCKSSMHDLATIANEGRSPEGVWGITLVIDIYSVTAQAIPGSVVADPDEPQYPC